MTHFQDITTYVGSGSYSPDGRWILYKTVRNGNYALWKIHPDGEDQTLVARFTAHPGTRDRGPAPTSPALR